MNFWEKIKKDLGKGIEEGIAMVKEGATVVKEKAEELTEEGKRRYKIFELKQKVQWWIAELGGRVYDLSSKIKNPMLDYKVKVMIRRIEKLEAQIRRIEEASKKSKKAITKRGKAK